MSLLFKTSIAALSAIVATIFVHSALAEDFLSEAEIKTVLGGNTIKFQKRAHRGNGFIYFGTDGEVVSKSDGSDNVSRGRWSVNEESQLCRERPYEPFFDVVCGKVTSHGKVFIFLDQYGDRSFSASVLNGRQLPPDRKRKY